MKHITCFVCLFSTISVFPCLASANYLSQKETISNTRPVNNNESKHIESELKSQRLNSIRKSRYKSSTETFKNTSEIDTNNLKCLPLKGVYLDGVTLLTNTDLKSLTGIPNQKCIREKDLNILSRELTALYIKKGYITSRVQFTKLDKDRYLGIKATEGFVENFIGNSNTINVGMLFPSMIGKPLNLKLLEQGLDDANRLSSNNLTMSLIPGKQLGSTIVNLNNTQNQSRLHGSLGFDNAGQVSTGKNISRASISIDSPLSLSDYISLSASTTISDHGKKYSTRLTALYIQYPTGGQCLTGLHLRVIILINSNFLITQ